MGNKCARKQKQAQNLLHIPIYAVFYFSLINFPIQIASYRDYIFVGGGGGNEIQNKIEVYQVAEGQGQKILKNKVHEESTQKDCPNFFDLGAGGLNIMAACVTAKVILYKIDI